jgi:hypothetical protein
MSKALKEGKSGSAEATSTTQTEADKEAKNAR